MKVAGKAAAFGSAAVPVIVSVAISASYGQLEIRNRSDSHEVRPFLKAVIIRIEPDSMFNRGQKNDEIKARHGAP